MDGSRKLWGRGPRFRQLAAWAALALALALPAWATAAEEPGTLKVSCEGATVTTLEALDAPVADVFRALEQECGLLLGGVDYIPERPVTATYQKVTLDEVVEDLLLLADLPNTVLGRDLSGALKLAVLPTGTPAPPKAAARPRAVLSREEKRDLERGEERILEFALEIARDKFLLAKTQEERQQALAEIRELPLDEAGEVAGELLEDAIESAEEKLELAKTDEERQRAREELNELEGQNETSSDEDYRMEVALEEALRQYELAKTDEERQKAYEAVKQLDPSEAGELLEDEEEEEEDD